MRTATTPDLKVDVGLVGLEVLHGERAELDALLQEPLGRCYEAGHRHGDPEEILDVSPMVTVHACGNKAPPGEAFEY